MQKICKVMDMANRKKNDGKVQKDARTKMKDPMIMVCAKCGKALNIGKFYANKGFRENNGRDRWCKDCAATHIVSKETLVDYCHENRRVFNERLYKICVEEVDKNLRTDLGYIAILDGAKKEQYRFEQVKPLYLRQMNLKAYYEFEEKDTVVERQLAEYIDNQVVQKKIEIAKEIVDDEISNIFADKHKHFSREWNGEFTDFEEQYLNDFYSDLEKEFDISDRHMEDNFREVAKASLEKTLAYNAKRRGEPDADKQYDKALSNYIKLSDQAKLSVSKRSANDRIGFSDLGNIVKTIESSGALCRKIEFEKDDVDTVLEDFYNTFYSYNPIEIAQSEAEDEDDF